MATYPVCVLKIAMHVLGRVISLFFFFLHIKGMHIETFVENIKNVTKQGYSSLYHFKSVARFYISKLEKYQWKF